MAVDPASIEPSQPVRPPAPERLNTASNRLLLSVTGGIFWAVIGGALMWGFLHQDYRVFRLPEEFADPPPMPSAEWTMSWKAATVVTRGHNAMFEVALFGALIAGCLALGDGIARRSMSAALLAGALCAALAAAAGCAAGLVGHLIWKQHADTPGGMSLAVAVGMHAVTFAILGGGIGAALGCAAVRRAHALLGYLTTGALAGAMAGALYPFLTATLTAYAGFEGQTNVVVPAGDLNCALWVAIPVLLLGSLLPGIKLAGSKS